MIRKLNGQISVQRLHGNVCRVPSSAGGGPLQAKTVYPSHSEQIIAPDEDFYGLALVTVKPTPRLPAFAMSVCEGNGDIFYGEVVENVALDGVGLSIGVGKIEEFQALYNGVKLPKIPDLVSYPYAWIRKNTTTGKYDLLVARTPWYYSDGTMKSTENNCGVRYTVNIDQADTALGWTHYGVITTASYSVDSSQAVFWSYHDIPNGSPDATDIYFEGTEPVPID